MAGSDAAHCCSDVLSHRPLLKNPKLLKNVIEVIREAGAEGGCSKAQGALLNAIATKVHVVIGVAMGCYGVL